MITTSEHIKVQDENEADEEDSEAKKAAIRARLARMGARPMMPGTMAAPSYMKQVRLANISRNSCTIISLMYCIITLSSFF